jgi:hypothetical protein
MSRLHHYLCLSLWLGLLNSYNTLAQSKYQTFDFLDLDVELLTEHQINQENVDYLKTAIARELTAKGLEQSSNPDLAINIGVVVKEEVQTRETDIRDMRYMGQRNYHWEVEEVVVGVYKVGTVSVELVDTKANRAVWEESEGNVIDKKQKNVQKKIDKGVSKIFKKFDPAKL